MKTFQSIAIAIASFIFLLPAAQAASLSYTKTGDAYAIYLDTESTVVNAGDFEIKANGNAIFTNISSGLSAGVPRPAGQPFTYRSRFLDLPTDDPDLPGVGKGWTILAPVVNSTEVSFAGGPLGQLINTAGEPGGKLFLANIHLPSGSATATAHLVNGLNTVALLTLRIPEPAGVALATTSLIGLCGLRRRQGHGAMTRRFE